MREDIVIIMHALDAVKIAYTGFTLGFIGSCILAIASTKIANTEKGIDGVSRAERKNKSFFRKEFNFSKLEIIFFYGWLSIALAFIVLGFSLWLRNWQLTIR